MKPIADELEEIIDERIPALKKISEEGFGLKESPGKWSKKEILGHLIDSAQNNIRRFIVAQYEDKPKIVYAQDFWVTAANYHTYAINDLVTLWRLLNRHICVVLKNIPANAPDRLCDTGDLRSIE